MLIFLSYREMHGAHAWGLLTRRTRPTEAIERRTARSTHSSVRQPHGALWEEDGSLPWSSGPGAGRGQTHRRAEGQAFQQERHHRGRNTHTARSEERLGGPRGCDREAAWESGAPVPARPPHPRRQHRAAGGLADVRPHGVPAAAAAAAGGRSAPRGPAGGLSQGSALTEAKVKQRPVPRGAGRPLSDRGVSDVAHPDVAGVQRSSRGSFTVLQSTPDHGSSVRCCNKLKKTN